MRGHRLAIAIAVAIAIAIAIAALFIGGPRWRAPTAALVGDEYGDVRVDAFAPCDGARDATTGVRRALERARGRVLTVPAGCRLLLRSPGAGRAALTVGSATTIRFESHSAAFVLARRRCVGGRFEGAGCHDDQGCRGGACQCEGGDGPDCPFAPVPEQSYLVLAAEPSSQAIVLDNLRIDVGGFDRFGRCAAGADAGLPCASSEDCRDGGACTDDLEPPSGPGRINAVDLSMVGVEADRLVPGADLRDLWIFDHTRGEFSAKTGPNARVVGLDNTLASNGARRPRRRPAVGLETGPRSHLATCTIEGFRVGVQLADFSTLRDSSVVTLADGADNLAGSAVYVAGTQDGVENNQLTGFHCLSVAPVGAANLTFADNRCLMGSGAKIVVSGPGISVTGNYLGWGSGAGGLCAAGPSAGLPCHAAYDCGDEATCDDDRRCRGGKRDGAPCGCRQSTCRPDPVIRINTPDAIASSGVDHLMIANNLVQTEFETAFIAVPDVGFRCLGGIADGTRCAMANDCGPWIRCDAGKCAGGKRTGSPCDCPDTICGPVTIRKSLVVGNNFYALSSMVGLDLSGLTSGGTKVLGLSVLANRFSAPGTCVALPADTANLSGLELVGNDFAACTLDERLVAHDPPGGSRLDRLAPTP